jgi:hypothetical protein
MDKIVDFFPIQDIKNTWWSTYAEIHIRSLLDHRYYPLQKNSYFSLTVLNCWWRDFEAGSKSLKMYKNIFGNDTI